MALSLSACRPLMSGITQAVVGCLAGRAASSSAPSSLPPAPPKRPSSIAEPTYTYASPGSSMREPVYNTSASDPVYFVDPKPDATQARAAAAAQALAQAQATAAEETAATAPGQRLKGNNTAPGSLKKIDFSAIAGKSDDGKPVSYRMTDDFAQVQYLTNPNTHSMREPKYVSVSDPKYSAADKKK